MEGADIYQIEKNCRTSVEMIEIYYASHLKNTLDAAAINVRKPRPEPRIRSGLRKAEVVPPLAAISRPFHKSVNEYLCDAQSLCVAVTQVSDALAR